jgi:hypothetical protein
MFSISEKIIAFSALGHFILSDEGKIWQENVSYSAHNGNQWFTTENIKSSLDSIAKNLLSADALKKIASTYTLESETSPKKVGLVLAGNIPLVGFHDILCVLLTNHVAYIKLSSQDEVLVKGILQKLLKIAPAFESQIVFADKLTDIEAVIATGSDNTAKHFDYYFKHLPKIIRKNRTSVAILDGTETAQDIQALGTDICTYYGLGCRNVSKLLVLGKFSPESFYPYIESFEYLMDNHKYKHNYDYNKSIYLLNRDDHFDNGFMLTRPSELLVSPISVVYYQEFDTMEAINQYISDNKDKLQCVVGNSSSGANNIAFGQAQMPGVFDYADGVDVMEFLLKL